MSPAGFGRWASPEALAAGGHKQRAGGGQPAVDGVPQWGGGGGAWCWGIHRVGIFLPH